jgi:hypothetical protein
MAYPPRLLCATRALKNAQVLQKAVPQLLPDVEPDDGFGSIIPLDILAWVHRRDRYAANGVDEPLLSELAKVNFPEISSTPIAPLFNGTIFFVRIRFTVHGKLCNASSSSDLPIRCTVWPKRRGGQPERSLVRRAATEQHVHRPGAPRLR